ALHPLTEWGRQRFGADVAAERRLAELESALTQVKLNPAEFAPLLAPLLNIPVESVAPELTPEELRRRQLAAMVAWVLAGARAQPLVLAFEDLHWADPTSLDLLKMLAERGATAPLAIVATGPPLAQISRAAFWRQRPLSRPKRSRRDARLRFDLAGYSKILLRVKSEAPFAPFATPRSSVPLSSSRTHPPLRATIAPIRPKPATLSPGDAVRIPPSIFSQTRSAWAPMISTGRAPAADAASEPVAAMSTGVEASVSGGVGPRTAPPRPRG